MEEMIRAVLEKIPQIRTIREVLEEKRERAYLVGGALRDIALGVEPTDLDFAALRPFEAARELASRLGTKVVSMGREAPYTYRVPLDGGYLDWVNLVGGSIEDDLARRDFTINAMAFDLDAQSLVDRHGSMRDLESRVIRMTHSRVFTEDPLRILKGYRHLAQLDGFSLDERTEKTMIRDRNGLPDMAPERVRQEFESLLAADSPGPVVRKMAESEILFYVLPRLKSLKELTQNEYHHADVLTHTLEVIEALDGPPGWLDRLGLARVSHQEPKRNDEAARFSKENDRGRHRRSLCTTSKAADRVFRSENRADPALQPVAGGKSGLSPFTRSQWIRLRLAALLHDVGKASTRSEGSDGRVHFYGHQKDSADAARSTLSRLRFSNEVVETVAELCLNHLRPLGLSRTRPGRTAYRRLVHSMGDLYPLLLALAYADKLGSRGRGHEESLYGLESLTREILEVARSDGEELRRLPKLVDGLEALDLLGLPRPGPVLGTALDALMHRQVSGHIRTKEAARAFLRGWAARNLTPSSLD